MTTRDDIIESGLATLIQGGLERWSIEAVAARTGCAKGLVHYHFRSKAAVLGQMAELSRDRRHRRRIQAWEKPGEAALDALWAILRSEVDTGDAVAWLALATLRNPDLRRQLAPSHAAMTELGKAAGRSLALAASSPEEIGRAVDAATAGFQIQLLLGENPEQVREAYHRFWLGLLS